MGTIADVIVLIIPGTIVLFLAINDLLKEKINWLKISILIILTLLLFFFGAWDIASKATSQIENKNEIIDTTKSNARQIIDTVSRKSDSINRNIDKNGKSLTEKIDSMQSLIDSISKKKHSMPEETPEIDVLSINNNPNPFVRKSADPVHYIFTIVTQSISNEIVYYPRNKLITFLYKNGIITKKWEISTVLTNKSTKMQNHQEDSSFYYFHLNKELKPTDTMYFFWKVKFMNNNNKDQHPLRKIYYLTNGRFNINLEEPGDKEYDQISKSLIKNKLW